MERIIPICSLESELSFTYICSVTIHDIFEVIVKTEFSKVAKCSTLFPVEMKPRIVNDKPRLLPQCINVNATQGTHTQMKSCDFEDVHNVKLLFRTPDPRQQNGNVLFYIVWFKSEGNDKLFQPGLSIL